MLKAVNSNNWLKNSTPWYRACHQSADKKVISYKQTKGPYYPGVPHAF